MKKILNKLIRNEQGQALIFALIMLAVGSLIVVPLLAFMSTGLMAAQTVEEKMNELYEHMVQEGLKIIEPVTMIIPIKNIKSIKNMDTLGIFKENFDVR